MKYQFLEIVKGADGLEYAYLLDEERGFVVRKPVRNEIVEDRNLAAKPSIIPQRIASVVAPEQPVATFHGMPLPDEEPANSEQVSTPHAEMPRPHSIVPPGMGGVFIEHEMPGAAVETRKTY